MSRQSFADEVAQRIGLRSFKDSREAQNAGYALVARFASAIGPGQTLSATIQTEHQRFYQIDQLNASFRLSATLGTSNAGTPVVREADATGGNNTANVVFASEIEMRITTNDSAWFSDFLPLDAIAGNAGAPAWFNFQPVIGGGEPVQVEIRNNSAAGSIVGSVALIGSKHLISALEASRRR